jgi:hypothetical protein
MPKETLDLIAKLAEEGRTLKNRIILAPVPESHQTFVNVLIDGRPYRLKLQQPSSGWWLMKPKSDFEAEVVGKPLPWQVVRYLQELPSIKVIAAHRLPGRAWLVYPWNSGDAQQRGWPFLGFAPQPRALHLVSGAIRPFDVLIGRVLGSILLYDEPDRRLLWAPVSAHLRKAFETDWKKPLRVKNASAEMRAVFTLLQNRMLEEQKKTLGGRIEAALIYSGATLKAWTEWGQGYEVVWTHEGREYRTILRPDLFVESAGICLSGRDSDFNLSAIVHVMAQARKLGRPGA